MSWHRRPETYAAQNDYDGIANIRHFTKQDM